MTLLRENQEFREAVRQAILTEELIALPAVFSAFASEMRGDVKRLDGHMQRLEGHVQRLDRRVERLEEGQQRLEDGQQRLEGRVERLEEGQQRLEGRVERLEFSVDSLRGSALEARLSTKLIPLVSREFNVRRVYPIWAPGVIAVLGNTKEFHDSMEQAAEDGVINDDDEIRLRVTDLVLRSQRKTDRSTLWFTVEASGIINDDDITRSKQSANAIEKIYGQDAMPIVYGYRIHEDQVKLADEMDVLVYLDPEGN